jgi:hypothetical protein
MKKKLFIILFIGLLLIHSANAEPSWKAWEGKSGRSQPNNVKGFNDTLNSMQGGSEFPGNFTAEEKELLRQENNFLIEKKFNSEILNLSLEEYKQLQQTNKTLLNESSQDQNLELLVFFLGGVIVLIIIFLIGRVTYV